MLSRVRQECGTFSGSFFPKCGWAFLSANQLQDSKNESLHPWCQVLIPLRLQWDWLNHDAPTRRVDFGLFDAAVGVKTLLSFVGDFFRFATMINEVGIFYDPQTWVVRKLKNCGWSLTYPAIYSKLWSGTRFWLQLPSNFIWADPDPRSSKVPSFAGKLGAQQIFDFWQLWQHRFEVLIVVQFADINMSTRRGGSIFVPKFSTQPKECSSPCLRFLGHCVTPWPTESALTLRTPILFFSPGGRMKSRNRSQNFGCFYTLDVLFPKNTSFVYFCYTIPKYTIVLYRKPVCFVLFCMFCMLTCLVSYTFWMFWPR